PAAGRRAGPRNARADAPATSPASRRAVRHPTMRRIAEAASWQDASADASIVVRSQDSRRQEFYASHQLRITNGRPAVLTPPPMRMVASKVVLAPFRSLARDSTLYVSPPPPATFMGFPSQPGISAAAGSPGGTGWRSVMIRSACSSVHPVA